MQAGTVTGLEDALEVMLAQGASDLHIIVGAPPSLRVNGTMRPIDCLPAWNRETAAKALGSILSSVQKAQFDRDLELDFAYTSLGARFRVNYFKHRDSIAAVFRSVSGDMKQLDELGIPDSVAGLVRLRRGLVLVTGTAGSGKSTTLAALIDLINRTRSAHIVTIEDPVEFLHSHKKSLVSQREIGTDTHSFSAALKHVLRQDPDVILIGELRDLETISAALTAAETGHLVLASLHTQNVAQTIDRLIDVFPASQQTQIRVQLAATLKGVVCQALLPKMGGGRVAATEVLVVTPAISHLIREGRTHQIGFSVQSGRALGMQSMDQSLADLVDQGLVSRNDAQDSAHDGEVLAQLIQRRQMGETAIYSGFTHDAPAQDSFSVGSY